MRYQIRWSASSNISFNGETEWVEVEEGLTQREVERDVEPFIMEEALDASGFEAWIEFDESD
jgi:hypothetical protein